RRRIRDPGRRRRSHARQAGPAHDPSVRLPGRSVGADAGRFFQTAQRKSDEARFPGASGRDENVVMPHVGFYAASDLAESDDFVRAQLALTNALRTFFKVGDEPTTTFRDDLLAVALFRPRSSAGEHAPVLLQGVFRRLH